MPSAHSLLLPLALAVLLSPVSGCASKALVYPPAADLVVEPKPVLSAEAVTDDSVGIAHDIAIEARGDRLAAQVGRMCRFWREMGMKRLDCPPPLRPE